MRAPKTDTEQRRQQIVRAALETIARDGLHGLGMAEVARRVGIVPSALYRHFAGKQEVLEAVMQMIARHLAENVELACREHDHALDRLENLLQRHLRMIEKDRAIPQVVLTEGLQSADPEARRLARGIVDDYLRRIRRIIRRGKKDGHIRADVHVDAAALVLLGLVLPAALLQGSDHRGPDPRRHLKHAWPIYRRGIEAHPDHERKT